MDLNLQKLRYFVTVANQLHFGRATDELHITQPALNRQIHALEQNLDTTLFTKNSHGVTLTNTGRQLLDDAGPLLTSAHTIRHQISITKHGDRRLIVGFRTGIPIIPATQIFEAQHPKVIVNVQRIEWDDQAQMLLDSHVDVGYVQLPIKKTSLHLTPLYTEPLIIALPTNHQLIGKNKITKTDLADEPLIWHADPGTQPTKHPHPDSKLQMRKIKKKLEHVAAKHGISFIKHSKTMFFAHPNINYIPISNLTPDQIFVAITTSHNSPLADDFFTTTQTTTKITTKCKNYEM